MYCPENMMRIENPQSSAGPDIPKSRILIGGFSQGGAVALSTLFSEVNRASSSEGPVAGCVALSTYMPGNKVPELKEKISTPIFQVMHRFILIL